MFAVVSFFAPTFVQRIFHVVRARTTCGVGEEEGKIWFLHAINFPKNVLGFEFDKYINSHRSDGPERFFLPRFSHRRTPPSPLVSIKFYFCLALTYFTSSLGNLIFRRREGRLRWGFHSIYFSCLFLTPSLRLRHSLSSVGLALAYFWLGNLFRLLWLRTERAMVM